MITPRRRGFNDSVTRFWNLAAPVYDLQVLQRWVYRPAQDEVLFQLQTCGARRVADIACGTGILADRIQRELHPDEVYGVDMSEGMLAQARSALVEGAVVARPGRATTLRRWQPRRRRHHLGVSLLRPARGAAVNSTAY